MNEDKCNLLITSQDEESAISHIGDEIIKNSLSRKLLGITIDNEVNHKLNVLARIANFMSTNKLRINMKSFIESQFGYFPWCGCSTVKRLITK